MASSIFVPGPTCHSITTVHAHNPIAEHIPGDLDITPKQHEDLYDLQQEKKRLYNSPTRYLALDA